MADPKTLDPAVVAALIATLGAGAKPDIVKQNGRVYQVQPDGSAAEVTGIPEAVPGADTSPTTVHVAGRGTLVYDPATKGWTVIPGTEEAPDAPKANIVEGGDGKKYTVTIGADGAPTGTAIAGIPGTPAPNPAKTAEQIAAESASGVARDTAQTGLLTAQAGAVESPEAAHSRRMSEINQTARAQGDALVAAAKAKVDAGLEMTEQDKLQLQSALDGIKSDHDAAIATAAAQFTHDLAQPNAAIDQGVAQQNADTSTQNAATSAAQQQATALSQQQQAQQASVNTQVDALKAQGAQGAANMDRVVKAGAAQPMSMATFRMATDPLQLAFQLAHQAVATGALPPSALPTRNGAPAPAAAAPAPQGAPLPAPGVTPPAAPVPALLPPGVAGTAADPRYASVMPPHGGPY